MALIAAVLARPAQAQHDHDSDDDHLSSSLWSQADAFYGAGQMNRARKAALHHGGAQSHWFVMFDRFEAQMSDDEDVGLWDAQGWYGGDINKLSVKSEAAYSFEDSGFDEAELQALWSRAATPYFDFQAGLRHDLEPDGNSYAVIGAQGLAPYWIEIDGAVFISEGKDVTARIEAELDFRLTQRLILQPRTELEFAMHDIPEMDMGAGLVNLQAGLRLRYEIKREFAPYIGVEWQGAFGETEEFVRASGGDPERAVLLLGIRAWY